MRALIMAGGRGTRLGRNEKPLTLLNGQPMIRFVTEAFRKAGCEPVVVVSSMTPMTANWCRAHNLPIVRTNGDGYIEDMVSAVQQLEEARPVVVSVSDIPCISSKIITNVLECYENCGKDALSTWIPAAFVRSCRGSMPYRESVRGVEACPAGINILRGDLIGSEQNEYYYLIDDIRLAFNVNTPDDLVRTEYFLLSADK